MEGLYKTNFQLHQQTDFYRGKVRDVYYFDDKMAVVTTDRISAFDVVMPVPIPHKGQILNEIAWHHLDQSKSIVPNWAIEKPHPNVTIGKRCKPIPIEMVVRGYLSGHAWREYHKGKTHLCGVPLPSGLQQNDPFPQPIITPATKATAGHDENISKEEILQKGLLDEDTWDKLAQYALSLFQKGQERAKAHNLILVDTKYEFGWDEEGQLTLIDEVHTPDSSRYFIRDSYKKLQAQGEKQEQLSKEFIREWLMSQGFPFDTLEIPTITESRAQSFSKQYQELYKRLMGTDFQPLPYTQREEEIRQAIERSIDSIN